jgi:DNA sulfur modification protein DndD
MILTNLTLTDFGTFRGEQHIPLQPKKSRPIVLFGGKNGAGKSTLLEAIRLCFYGSGATGTRSKDEYARYLDQKIHTNANALIQPTSASVAIEFQYGDVDGLRTYLVTRSWERKSSGKIVEDLRVERDGRPLDDVSAEHWQDFVRDLLPPGVSNLFFFDGERIQQLAEDSSDEQTLADAIKSLLGLDVVERLQTDLGIYLARLIKPLGRDSEHADELTSVQEEITAVEVQIEGCRRQREAEQERLRELKSAIQRLEEQIASRGGSFTRNREGLIQKQAALKSQIQQQETTLRELSAGLLPFALIPSLCRELKDRLLAEESLAQEQAARTLLHSKRDAIKRKIGSENFWKGLGPISSPVKAKLRTRLAEIFETSLRLARRNGEVTAIHHVSAEERSRMLSWIDQATEDIPKLLLPLRGEIERSYRELHKAEDALRKIPADDVLKPSLEELRSLNHDLAEVGKRLLGLDEALRSRELKLTELRRRFEQATERLTAQLDHASRVHLVPQVKKVLEEYKSSLIHKKVLQLQEAVTECFQTLCRKKDSLGRIIVDPNDFSVTLQDKHNRPLPKAQLSAGEKQIYAISMLWALAKTSGRPLPIIIDTPLARLDSDHRKLLAQHYFPFASHQVLILSTDTEVDQSYFEELRDSVGQAYRLDFDPEENGTKVAPGYFWRHANENN